MNNKAHYDVIVIGVGSMGSSACYYLARSGASVLGLEQFSVPHESGSHAGQSRIIRKAYYEHPDYVPLLEAAYRNWRELETVAGEKVYHDTGLLYFGKPDHPVMEGVRLSSRLYNIPVLNTDTKEYPQLSLVDGQELMFEPDAGFLQPEKAIRLYAEMARRAGAEIKTQQKVLGWKEDGIIRVSTAEGEYTSDKLVVCSGAWTGKLLPSLDKQLTVTRQVLAWVEPEDPAAFAMGRFPCWMYAEDGAPGVYYGFPVLPGAFGEPSGFKLAYHCAGEVTDADRVRRTVSALEADDLIRVLRKYFKGGSGRVKEMKVCLYTNTADEHFIVDLLPGSGKVAIAAGFSGHGFKFASVIGEVLADLALKGTTLHPIGFLSADRPLVYHS